MISVACTDLPHKTSRQKQRIIFVIGVHVSSTRFHDAKMRAMKKHFNREYTYVYYEDKINDI